MPTVPEKLAVVVPLATLNQVVPRSLINVKSLVEPCPVKTRPPAASLSPLAIDISNGLRGEVVPMPNLPVQLLILFGQLIVILVSSLLGLLVVQKEYELIHQVM